MTETFDRRLRALAGAGRTLSGATDADHLLDLTASWVFDVVAADAVSVSVIDHAHGCLRTLCNAGELARWEQPRPTDEIYPLADYPQASRVLEQSRPWIGVVDDPDLPQAERDLLVSLGKHTAVSVPIVRGTAVWGELYLTRTVASGPFTADDVAAAEAFAGLVSAAMSHLEARTSLHEMAYRDPLTGLANRRAVDEELERVFADVVLDRSLAVVLCDVNDLKDVNDTFGHATGDLLLRDVGNLLSLAAGEQCEGLAARIGGDEFCLLARGMADDEVRTMVADLTERAAALSTGDGLACGWTTVTARPGGAATAGAASRAVLRLADAAQYRAKRQQRPVSPAPAPRGRTDVEVSAADVARVLARMADSDGDAASRLVAVAATLSEVLDVAAWWVSRHDGDGRLTVLRHGYARVGDRGPDAVVIDDGVWFDLDDYPETAAALDGGVLWATLATGDRAEREYLAANGYAEIVGAGASAPGCQWLVELCADALSAPLAPHQGLVRALTELAVSGVDPRADRATVDGRDDATDEIAAGRPAGRPATPRLRPHPAGPGRGLPLSAPTEAR